MEIGKKAVMVFCVILSGYFYTSAQQIDKPAAMEKFQEIDVNKDGFITSDEMQTYQKIKFDKLDTDKSETLDQKELREDKEQTFEKADKDTDAKISRQEAFAQFNDYFNKMDSNKDSKISENEFKEYWPMEVKF